MDKITQTRNRRLAEAISEIFDIDKRVFNAIASTDRGAFVPAGFSQHAYRLDALPISSSQWISSPLTVAKMTHYLDCEGADRVLEIGCGSGYQAAILSHLFRGVFTIERIERLATEAKMRFKEQGFSNVHTRTDDGQRGWMQYAPYDRIIFSATAKDIPQAIKDQLCDGGILLAPILQDGKEIITKFTKTGSSLKRVELEECKFVPIVDGVQK